MMENLVWKAYYHSMSGHEIRPFNIFEHGRFREEVRKLLLKCTEKEAYDKASSPSSENSVQNQAQQNNKQPRQISQKPTDTERTARTSNQTEYKRQAQSSKMDIWFENK